MGLSVSSVAEDFVAVAELELVLKLLNRWVLRLV
jgi:hypothetical protein